MWDTHSMNSFGLERKKKMKKSSTNQLTTQCAFLLSPFIFLIKSVSLSLIIFTLVAWWMADDKAREDNAQQLCYRGDCLC